MNIRNWVSFIVAVIEISAKPIINFSEMSEQSQLTLYITFTDPIGVQDPQVKNFDSEV